MEEKQISKAVISRLPRYYRALTNLKNSGVARISSQELGDKMKLTASQIRQDLNQFGCFGQQGYGYNVEFLFSAIAAVIGLENDHEMIICGAGNIGHALANYPGFTDQGFVIKAVFDINPNIVGTTINHIPIYSMDELAAFTKENKVDIAILAVPGVVAFETAKKLFDLGVTAIWNFTNVDLHAPEGMHVVDVHLMDSLMTLAYEKNAT